MMKAGHRAMSAPFAVGLTYSAATLGEVHPLPAVGAGVLVVLSSTWPDLDHPRFRGSLHFGAAVVRGLARLAYRIRTEADRERGDVHRGPSHCLEAAILVGLLVVAICSRAPVLEPWAWWFGGAVALGWASHIGGDAMTPSGVPISAVYSYLRHGEVWRRYSLSWFATDSGGERFVAVPLLYGATALLGLGLLGLLGPVFAVLTGIGL